MSDNKNLIDNFQNFVDRNIRWIRWCMYGTAAIGGIVFVHQLHLFRVFRRPTDIPTRFIERSIQLRARVSEVSDGATLKVRHIPVIKLPWLASDAALTVKLAGVEGNVSSKAWLEMKLLNTEVKFTPLLVRDGELHSTVSLKRRWILYTNVNKELIETGVCKVAGLETNGVSDAPGVGQPRDQSPGAQQHLKFRIQKQQYWRFIDKLLALEIKAEKKQRGVWRCE